MPRKLLKRYSDLETETRMHPSKPKLMLLLGQAILPALIQPVVSFAPLTLFVLPVHVQRKCDTDDKETK